MKKKGKEEDWQKANGSWRVRMREDPRESQEGRITLLTSVCSKSGIPTGLQFPCIPVMTQLHNSQLLIFSRLLRKLFCIGEGNGNPLQRSCLENPGYRGAWWAAVSGVAQSRTWLKRLSSSSRRKLFTIISLSAARKSTTSCLTASSPGQTEPL